MDDIILNVKKSIEEIQQLHWTSIMDFPFYLINLINRSYSTDAVKDNRLKKKHSFKTGLYLQCIMGIPWSPRPNLTKHENLKIKN